jgi:hypothetical protein
MMIKVLLSHLQIAGLCNGACVMPTLYVFRRTHAAPTIANARYPQPTQELARLVSSLSQTFRYSGHRC